MQCLLCCGVPKLAHTHAQAEGAELPVQGYPPKVVAMRLLCAGFRMWAGEGLTALGQRDLPKQRTQLGDTVTGLAG